MAGVAVTQSRHEGEGEELLASRAVLGAEAVERYTQQAVPDAATSQRCDVTSAVAALTVYSCRAAPPALGPIQRAVQCCVHRAQTLRYDNNQTKQWKSRHAKALCPPGHKKGLREIQTASGANYDTSGTTRE